ncbi:hypothetical protein OIE66_33975 [Nonomuraea sp. NBC_01738]|uniref:hypothetical protein n=1 Tax=Nonomuraea sp. NBC_01738 TaxID=2976003 RepID=UPI002E0F1399|nr:hypothetical protein OIE66_33975 [Nonomuraea sp. NBC_01738]
MTGWADRMGHAASLLAGRTAGRLAGYGDSPAAYFRMFRRFLSPLRAWDAPAWSAGMSRRQRAVLVATLHEGWDEQDTAELCGLSPATVRALAVPEQEREALAARLRASAALPGPSPSRLAKLLAAAVLLSAAGSAVFVPPPPPSPSLPALPAATAEPIRYGLRVRQERFPDRIEPFASPEPTQGWLVVGASGRRWRLPDALPDAALAVSPDGGKLAYYSLARMQVVIRNVTTGAITPIPTPFYQVRLAFSADGHHLAMEQPETMVVADTRTAATTSLPVEESLLGWAGDRLVTSRSFDGIQLLAQDGSVIAAAESATLESHRWDLAVSPDGRSIALPSDGRVLILGLDGKVRREVRPDLPPTAEPKRVHRWTGPGEVLLYAPGYGSATVYAMDVVTGATRPIPYAPEVAAADFTIGAP